jgi:hypothetical protein
MLSMRKARDSGVVDSFGDLPFAADVDGRIMPGVV